MYCGTTTWLMYCSMACMWPQTNSHFYLGRKIIWKEQHKFMWALNEFERSAKLNTNPIYDGHMIIRLHPLKQKAITGVIVCNSLQVCANLKYQPHSPIILLRGISLMRNIVFSLLCDEENCGIFNRIASTMF